MGMSQIYRTAKNNMRFSTLASTLGLLGLSAVSAKCPNVPTADDKFGKST